MHHICSEGSAGCLAIPEFDTKFIILLGFKIVRKGNQSIQLMPEAVENREVRSFTHLPTCQNWTY
jgi:hypothetical protein